MSFESNLLGGLRTRATNSAADLVTGIAGNISHANKIRTGGLQAFISQMNTSAGFFRGTFFEVAFYNMDTGTFNGQNQLSLLCHQSSIPGVRLETVPNTIYSLKYETPIGVEFDPLYCTAYIDNDFTTHNALYNDMLRSRINTESWSPKYRDPTKMLKIIVTMFATDLGILGSTTTPLSKKDVSGLPKTSHDGLPVKATFVLNNAFIKAVQQTPLDWGAQNQVSSVTFEISYEWFDVVVPGGIGSDKPINFGTDTAAVNAATIFTKFPILGTAYDAAKRTAINNPAILNNPALNQLGQFLP